MLINFFNKTKNQIFLIIILTVFVFSNIFKNGFVIDDTAFVLGWETKNSLLNIGQFFQGDVPIGHEGVYRPVRSIFYALYYQLFGTNPFIYHLHALAVHLSSTILIYLITRLIVLDSKNLKSDRISSFIPFSVALLFGMHPIHTETITYISSAMESMGLTFYLGAFYLYLRSRNSKKNYLRIGSVLLALAAFFTTEFTLTLPLVLILFDACYGNLNTKNWTKKITVYLPYFTGVFVYLGIRFLLLDIKTRGPFLADSIYLTVLAMTKVIVKYLSLVVFPLNQANNHTISGNIEAFIYRGYNPDPILAQNLFDPEIIFSAAVIIGLGIAAVRFYKSIPLLSFGIGWFFITLLPVSEIVPQGSILNEKFLYLPSFGIILIVVLGLVKATEIAAKRSKTLDQQKILLVSVGIISILMGTLTYLRNSDWKDELTLWSKDVNVYPETNAYAYFQLGNVYLGRNEFNPAVLNYQKAYEINPHFTVALASIGRVYEVAGERDLAVVQYEKVLAADPVFWEGYRNLANIYQQQGEFNKAREVLERMKTIYPEAALSLLEGIPKLTEATESGNLKQPDLWLRYHLKQGISLNLPSLWKLSDKDSEVEVVDDKGGFSITMTFSKKSDESNEDYVEKQPDAEFGQLVNRGMAKIPQFEWSFVKVFEREGNQSMVFYLIENESVIKAVIFPVRQEYNADVDKILGSIYPDDRF